jgi:bifunctional non-homologous end joining protein LigD
MAKRERKLSAYRAKRDFSKTPEPKPKVKAKKPASKLRFCVQKHMATTLHYDFRLEHEGVLLSWAVPKGPSLNPADKRMAMKVEDHPIDYGDFEGVIPSGYGAGIVMLWDKGTWTPETPDVSQGLKDGELKFSLNGVKLKGSWVLVRTRRFDGAKEAWLLIKHRDEWAGNIDVAEAAPDSVKSFKGFPEIAKASGELDEFKDTITHTGGTRAERWKEVIDAAENLPKKKATAPRRAGAGLKKTRRRTSQAR